MGSFKVVLCALGVLPSSAWAWPVSGWAGQPEPQPAGPEPVWALHCMPNDPEAGDFSLVGGPVRVLTTLDETQLVEGVAGSARLVEGLGWVDSSSSDGQLLSRVPNPANRVQLVFVGDGYTAPELPVYAQQVTAFAEAMFEDEPLATYRPLFAVHRVDVISPESGVDNDPSQGIQRNTALDMEFWCGGTERLLCVNVGKARNAANQADLPEGQSVDQVLALANSSKYGGAGYPSQDVGTASANNGSAVEVVVHELGHSFANLGDEYDYGGPTNYPGQESSEANISTRTAAQMAAQNTKWASWLNQNTPAYDGLHSTYQGAQYSQLGVYRPTNNSKMRSLFRPFNLVSAEAIIKNIYLQVDPIDGFSPVSPSVTAHTTLSVTPVQPIGASLSVQWFLDGLPIQGATATTLETCGLPLSQLSLIEVQVTDTTPLVRDEAFRVQHMTQSVAFVVAIPSSKADTNADGILSPADFSAWIAAFNAMAPACDQNSDGFCTPADFSAWIANYNAGCP